MVADQFGLSQWLEMFTWRLRFVSAAVPGVPQEFPSYLPNRSRMIKHTSFLCLLARTAALSLALPFSVSGSAQHVRDRGGLTRRLDAVLNSRELRFGFQGVEVDEAISGKPLYRRNTGNVFMPASNNKLLTSGAALALLGQDYQYRTQILAQGTLQKGILSGDLVIRGSGDPTLSAADLRSMTSDLKATGLSSITGGIRYDASVFDEQWLGESWEWDDEPFYYAAQVSGLNVDRNVTLVSVTAGSVEGQPAIVSLTSGAEQCLRIENSAITGRVGSAPHILVGRRRGENTITVSGTIPIGSASAQPITAAVTFENPALYTASLLLADIKQTGITIGDNHVLKLDRPIVNGQTLVTHSSEKLTTILGLMNKPSDNMIAECLLKTAGALKEGVGTAGISGTGAVAARDWLLSIGLDKNQLRQVDGSGLSRQNYVSPANVAKLLRYWAQSTQFNTFYNSLPVAGVDGTLKNRLKGTLAENNCHAKTGSIGQCSCLSGYVTSNDGVLLVFSILMNNQLGSMAPCIAAENKIVQMLAEAELRPAQSPDPDIIEEHMK